MAIAPVLTRWVLGGVLLAPAFVFAGTPSYSQSGSTATFRHHNQGSSAGDKVTTFNPGSSSSMTLWSSTFGTPGAGNQFTQAFAGIGSVTNPTTTTFALKAGTGVNQNDPPHNWTASSLTLSFTGNWTTVGQFGPTATAYFSMGYAGVSNGTVTARAQVSFFANGGLLRSIDSGILTIPSGGVPTVKTWTASKILNSGTFASGTQLKTMGTITFTADNDIALSNLYPTNFDCGNAPMTANWQPDSAGTIDWNTASNWTQDPSTIDPLNNDIINGVPNGQGQRARFANRGLAATGLRNINVATGITLGTLDIDDDDPFTFLGAGSLTFDVQQGECVIRTGNTHGGGVTDTMDNAVVLNKTVVAQTEGTNTGGGRGIDSAANLTMNGVISGTGGFTKVGEASCSLNATNAFSGGTAARGGYLNANATLSLGTGTVLADDGQLNYNAIHAAAAAITSNAQNNGQINLGILPNNERFALHDLGAVSGSPAELTALSTLAGGNLTVDTGAMIAHESFDFGPAGNPAGLFNTGTASYIFGIAADFNATNGFEATVGSASGTIWKGFGGDRGNRLFGFDPNTATLILGIAGTTELVSLHNTLTINAQVQNAGPGASIIKRGGGVVALNNVNNPYVGAITIQSGTLAIGGGLNNVTSLTVNGNTAALNMQPGGSLGAPTISLGGGGQLVMDGGQVNCTTLADNAGQIHVNAGTIGVTTLSINGGGQMFVDGGVVNSQTLLNIDGQLHVNAGTLNVGTFMNSNPGFLTQFSGGVTNVGSFVPSGTVLLDGGRLNATGLVTAAIGTFLVNDGTLNVTNASQLNGQSFFTGGVATFNSNLSVATAGFVRYNGGSLSVNGTLTMSGGSLLIGTGTQRLLKVGNVVTSGGGRVDLNDSDMIATASTYPTISGLVAIARNGGAWNLGGITSSAARNNPAHSTTLGVVTGSQYLATGNTTFDGQNVTATNVLVKYTYYGDSDLNGTVNFDDYSRIDNGFNSGGTSWFQGDFDYNGQVNFDDYALIDLAFNTQSGSLKAATRLMGPDRFVPGDLSGSPALQSVLDHYAQFGESYRQAFLSAVPEPAGAGALLLGLAGTLTRSIRRMRRTQSTRPVVNEKSGRWLARNRARSIPS